MREQPNGKRDSSDLESFCYDNYMINMAIILHGTLGSPNLEKSNEYSKFPKLLEILEEKDLLL